MVISRVSALGAVAALGTVGPLALLPALSAERADPGDVKLLEGALELELAAIKAYGDAAAGNLSAPVAATLMQFSNDHSAHRDALLALVQQAGQTPGTDAATVPAVVQPQLERDALAGALTLERQLASSYLAAVPEFKNRDLAKTAASILGVDATHVALLSEALRENPAYPGGFLA